MSFKILSLDGGGSWAILQAMALQEIYKGKTCRQILSQFDLVAANSGGSLMLACMIEFDTMAQVIEMFLLEKNRKDVFSKTLNPQDKKQ
jgi:patatin-like phospholipase/acyl hydrolase